MKHASYTPLQGCDGANSYAAVTCSIHRSGMPFRMDIQAQQKAGKGSCEVIENFDSIVKRCLVAYRNCTDGLKPRRIIYYRDGVGQGQFTEVIVFGSFSNRKIFIFPSLTLQL